MLLPVAEAARMVGLSRSRIMKAVRRGALSASRDAGNGQRMVESSEVTRIDKPVSEVVTRRSRSAVCTPWTVRYPFAWRCLRSPEARFAERPSLVRSRSSERNRMTPWAVTTRWFWLLVVLSGMANAEQVIYPTHPGTNLRDYSKPGYIAKTDRQGKTQLYPTHPGTALQDYSKPGWSVEKHGSGQTQIHPTHPGTSLRDYSQPGLLLDRDRHGQVHSAPTHPGTNLRDYRKPGTTTSPAWSQGSTLYPTHPGTNLRDYAKPDWNLKPERNGNTSVYPTHPGSTLRDYRQPGYVIKDQ